MKLFFLSFSISALGLLLVSVASASPIPSTRAVAFEERSVLNTLPSAQILRREDGLLYGRGAWEKLKAKVLPKKKELTEEEKKIKIWRLQNKLNKEMEKHRVQVAKVEHDIGKKLIVSSYHGDSADRAMAVKKAEGVWDHGHKCVDISVKDEGHKKTITLIWHNGPGTPRVVPYYIFVWPNH